VVPLILPIAVAEVILEQSLVFARAILPSQVALAVHLALEPFAQVSHPVLPLVLPSTLNLVVLELALVNPTIDHSQPTQPIFQSLLEFSLVDRTIWPLLHSLPMLKIISPHALVVSAILLGARALSIHLVVDPGAFNDCSFGCHEFALSIGQPLLPIAQVVGVVRKKAEPVTVQLFSQPRPDVDRAVSQFDRAVLGARPKQKCLCFLVEHIRVNRVGSASDYLRYRVRYLHTVHSLANRRDLLRKTLYTAFLLSLCSSGGLGDIRWLPFVFLGQG